MVMLNCSIAARLVMSIGDGQTNPDIKYLPLPLVVGPTPSRGWGGGAEVILSRRNCNYDTVAVKKRPLCNAECKPDNDVQSN